MIIDTLLPDELMLEWADGVPEDTYVKIYVPTWNSSKVLELANQLYSQHDLTAEDEHTIVIPLILLFGKSPIANIECIFRQVKGNISAKKKLWI